MYLKFSQGIFLRKYISNTTYTIKVKSAYNLKEQRCVNTVVFNLLQIKRRVFFLGRGTPDIKLKTNLFVFVVHVPDIRIETETKKHTMFNCSLGLATLDLSCLVQKGRQWTFMFCIDVGMTDSRACILKIGNYTKVHTGSVAFNYFLCRS